MTKQLEEETAKERERRLEEKRKRRTKQLDKETADVREKTIRQSET